MSRIVDHVDRTKEKKTLADYGVKWEAEEEFPLASSNTNWDIQNVVILTTCENHVKTAKCHKAAMPQCLRNGKASEREHFDGHGAQSQRYGNVNLSSPKG